jgi:hypothetical protein
MKNTKFALSCLILLFVSFASLAQSTEIEFLGGISFASQRGTYVDENNRDFIVGPNAGLALNFLKGDHVVFSAGLLYDRKGSKERIEFRDELNNPLFNGDLTYVFNYISLPVQIGYRFGSNVKFQVGAGFYAAYLLKDRFYIESSEVIELAGFDVKKFDAGMSLSLSSYFPISSKVSLKFGLFENLGFANVADEGSTELRNNSFGAHAGLNLKLK